MFIYPILKCILITTLHYNTNINPFLNIKFKFQKLSKQNNNLFITWVTSRGVGGIMNEGGGGLNTQTPKPPWLPLWVAIILNR